MQEPDAAGHPKMLTYLKHYTACKSSATFSIVRRSSLADVESIGISDSREQNRRESEANISLFDLRDTYTRQYELAFNSSRPPHGVM